MRNFLLFLACCVMIQCKNEKDSNLILKNFNALATASLQSMDFHKIGLRKEREVCILKKTVMLRLDSVSGPEIISLYPFSMKRFYIDEINLHFSIFSDKKNKFHFVSQPILKYFEEDCGYKYYFATNGDSCRLREKSKIIKLNVDEILKVLVDDCPEFANFQQSDKIGQIFIYNKLVSSLYDPYLQRPIALASFAEYLQTYRDLEQIDTLSYRYLSSSIENDFHTKKFSVFIIENLGFIFLDFKFDGLRNFQMGFLPFPSKKRIYYNGAPSSHIDCES